MRPRAQPEPADPGGMPLQLRRFEPDEWAVGPPPDWWRDADHDPLAWAHFKAKLLHMRARRDWLREHGHPPYPAA
jgi:hypothetical protein